MSIYNNIAKFTLLVLAFLSLFSHPIAGITGLGFLTYFDEAILVFSVLILTGMLFLMRSFKPIYILVPAFFVYSVLISLTFGYNRNVVEVVAQSLINIKFIVLLLAFAVLFRNSFRTIRFFFNFLLAISLAGMLLHLLLGSYFNDLFAIPVVRRSGSYIRYGGFFNPNQMAYLMAFWIGMVLNSAKIRNTFLSAKDWGKIALSLLIILLTDSRSALIGILFFFIAYYWKFILRHTRIFLSFVVVLLVSLTLFLTFSNTLETILINLQGASALTAITFGGLLSTWPYRSPICTSRLGPGRQLLGRSLSDGSPVYEYFGVAKRYFFVEKKGIYDSSVASIVGEYGFIGICFYITIIILSLALFKNNRPEYPEFQPMSMRSFPGLYFLFCHKPHLYK